MQNLIKIEDVKIELTTIRDFIRFGITKMSQVQIFYGHGTDNSFDEIIYLVYGYLNLPFDNFEFYLDTRLTGDEKELLLELLNKRLYQNIPTAYLINKAYLNGFEFYVDERTIIPRSFIANIILNKQLDEYIEHPEMIGCVLDLCTGNGSLAIIAANYFYDANIIATDINQDALDVASINIEKHHLEDVISLIKSNLFEELTSYKNTFDLIISNPPYVDRMRIQNLPKEYLYEPNISLDGGECGIEFISTILEQSRYYLNDFGILLVEMGDNRSELEVKYPGLNLKWFDTKHNDGFIFMVTKDILIEYFD
jgi:ribosomal protein L3 glutamine methyltransferase